MAHQVSSPGSGSPSVQPVLTSVIPSASQTPLDLNLSQKAFQNPLKGQDEPVSSHQKASEASPSPHQENVPKVSLDVLPSNGGLHSPSKSISEHRGGQQTPTTPQKLNADPGETATNVHNVTPQKGTAVFEAGPSAVIGSTPTSSARKRKSPRVKQPPPDTNKKIILALEANEDEVVARPSKEHLPKSKAQGVHLSKSKPLESHLSKSKPPLDIAERRLLLDERKMRLAEQRFTLEEKKLEATIEIGKGLIISMERMTNTISSLGFASTHHR